MDIVLEGFDTYLFDPIYASIFPVAPKSAAYNAFSGNGSASIATVKDIPTPQYNNWEYRPASQFLSFKPSSWAYQSSWQRDDPWRQFISLFTITWCAYYIKSVQPKSIYTN
jgi:lathosterol oxidase